MNELIQKNFISTRNLTYHYYISPASSKNPTLLFLHGWPDSSALWQEIAPSLGNSYRVLIPDLLGFGESSKPLDSQPYGIGYICHDLAELLEHEEINEVIPVGHDWGSNIATRMALFFPSRVKGVVLLNVGYIPPQKAGAAAPKSVRELNDFFEKMTGSRRFEYHEFFLADDAAAICEAHLESLWSAMHRSTGPQAMREMFCTPNTLRKYVSTGQLDALKPYARDPALRNSWIADMNRGGIRASFNWYHAIWDGHHAAAEKEELAEHNGMIAVPVLYLSADEDVLCPGEEMEQQAGLLPDLTTREIHAGHWLPYEAPEAVVEAIRDWLCVKGL